MSLSPKQKALVGLMTFGLPLLMVGIYLLAMSIPLPAAGDPVMMRLYGYGRLGAVLAISACQVALLVIYVRLVMKLNRPADQTLWLIAVLAAGILGELLFFFMKVLPSKSELAEAVSATTAGPQGEPI